MGDAMERAAANPRRMKEKPVSAAFINRCRVIRSSLGWSSDTFAAAVRKAGFPLSHQMVRNQESRSAGYHYGVSLDQALAAAEALGRTIDEILSGPVCTACGDEPPPRTRCLVCEAENHGS